MNASTHLAVGAAVGLASQSILPADSDVASKVLLSLSAGFLSHIVLDASSHYEYTLKGLALGAMLFAEISAVFVLVFSLNNGWLTNTVIFAGMAGGALPDVVNLVNKYIFSRPWIGNLGEIVHFFHFEQQKHPEPLFGFYFQVLITILAVMFVRFKSA